MGAASALLVLIASGWQWLHDKSGLDPPLLVLIRAGLAFGVVFAFAWVMSVVYRLIEKMPDPGDGEA